MRRLLASVLLASLAAACAGDPDADGADDCFLCGKNDAFGIVEGSCEANAILALVDGASRAELDDDVGLDRRAATAIVAAREERPIATLADLDEVRFVGAIAFGQLVEHLEATGALPCEEPAEEATLVVPLVDEEDHDLLSRFNPQIMAAGLEPLPDAVDVSRRSDWDAMMERVFAANEAVEGMPAASEFASGPDDFGKHESCYRGRPDRIPDLTDALVDQVLSDMYSVVAWRAAGRREINVSDFTEKDIIDFAPAWADFDDSTGDILIVHGEGDDGIDAAVVEPCAD
jgi:hypothetical protein